MNGVEYSREEIARLIENMCQTEGFKIYVQFLNSEREKIITEGKKSRSEEKKIMNWAKLDGFDKSVELLVKLRKFGNIGDIKVEEEDL